MTDQTVKPPENKTPEQIAAELPEKVVEAVDNVINMAEAAQELKDKEKAAAVVAKTKIVDPNAEAAQPPVVAPAEVQQQPPLVLTLKVKEQKPKGKSIGTHLKEFYAQTLGSFRMFAGHLGRGVKQTLEDIGIASKKFAIFVLQAIVVVVMLACAIVPAAFYLGGMAAKLVVEYSKRGYDGHAFIKSERTKAVLEKIFTASPKEAPPAANATATREQAKVA